MAAVFKGKQTKNKKSLHDSDDLDSEGDKDEEEEEEESMDQVGISHSCGGSC